MRLFLSLMLSVLMACSSGGDGGSDTGGSGTGGTGDTGTVDTGSTTDDTGGDTATGATTDTPGIWSEDCATDMVEFRTVDVGEVSLNVACRGAGPTIILLHGFPEFWFGWNDLMADLSADFRVIAPDQRGYNTSDKPPEQADYEMPHLVADVVGLIDAVSTEPVLLVGHDWGGAVAWVVGAQHPDKLSGLIIANGPHPNVFSRELAENPDQQAASSYVSLLLTEGSETAMGGNDFALLVGAMEEAGLSDEDLGKYKDAWGQPEALLSMVRWYRANLSADEGIDVDVTIPDLKTLVLWGMADSALLPGNLIGLDQYVTNLTIRTLPGVSHWINHNAHEDVATAIRAFAAGEAVTVGEDAPDPDDRPVEDPPVEDPPVEDPPEEDPPVEDPPEPTEPPTLPAGLYGQAAPDYLGLPSLAAVTDEEGVQVTEDDFKGHWTVMWFYPKAKTPG